MTTCTRCQGTGFLNIHQLDEQHLELFDEHGPSVVLQWISNSDEYDVQVCDCCGDGENWHGEAGSHYIGGDEIGVRGPYAYNGGLCECH
jgi:hypothetical protein